MNITSFSSLSPCHSGLPQSPPPPPSITTASMEKPIYPPSSLTVLSINPFQQSPLLLFPSLPLLFPFLFIWKSLVFLLLSAVHSPCYNSQASLSLFRSPTHTFTHIKEHILILILKTPLILKRKKNPNKPLCPDGFSLCHCGLFLFVVSFRQPIKGVQYIYTIKPPTNMNHAVLFFYSSSILNTDMDTEALIKRKKQKSKDSFCNVLF